MFTFACLGIAAITVALRTSLARAHQLAAEAFRQGTLLRESEQRLQAMAEVAPVLIRMHDAACVYCNPMWLQYTGRTLGHELGHGWSEGMHPDDRGPCLEAFEAAFDKGAPFTLEYRLRDAGGAYRVMRDTGVARFDIDGTFIGCVNACMEVPKLAPQPTGGRQEEAGGSAAGS